MTVSQFSIVRFSSVAVACLLIFSSGCQQGGETDSTDQTGANEQASGPVLKPAKLGTTKTLTQYENFYLAGQFTKDDIAILKDDGVQVVINLREDGEIDWDEKTELENAGIEYVSIPFSQPDTLTDEKFAEARSALKENSEKKVMLHCGSAVRVGAIWGAYRCLDDGLSIEDAIAEAKNVGMRGGHVDHLEEYLTRQKTDSGE